MNRRQAHAIRRGVELGRQMRWVGLDADGFAVMLRHLRKVNGRDTPISKAFIYGYVPSREARVWWLQPPT